MVRPLAIVRDTPLKDWEAATPVNEALKPIGIQIPLLDGSIRGIATSAKFKEKHPERFEKLVAAYKRAQQNKQLLEQLNNKRQGADRAKDHTYEHKSLIQNTYDDLRLNINTNQKHNKHIQ